MCYAILLRQKRLLQGWLQRSGGTREVILRNRVQKNADESNGGADGIRFGDWILEDKDSSDDNDYPLDSVCNGIEEQARNEQVEQQLGGGDDGCGAHGGGLPRADELGRVIDDESKRSEDDGGHDGQHGE
ncbi:glucose-6-phosphate/phosphate-translocator precursor [Gracilaria domingensis]|nr:glucose-6-phosphate/phosphate-translocator precursor [Gracilaria domingensis]